MHIMNPVALIQSACMIKSHGLGRGAVWDMGEKAVDGVGGLEESDWFADIASTSTMVSKNFKQWALTLGPSLRGVGLCQRNGLHLTSRSEFTIAVVT